MERKGGDDNVSRPMTCRSGKNFSIFLIYTFFFFFRKDLLYKLHGFLLETQFLQFSFYLCLKNMPFSVIKE